MIICMHDIARRDKHILYKYNGCMLVWEVVHMVLVEIANLWHSHVTKILIWLITTTSTINL
jgi:hypothetical protein